MQITYNTSNNVTFFMACLDISQTTSTHYIEQENDKKKILDGQQRIHTFKNCTISYLLVPLPVVAAVVLYGNYKERKNYKHIAEINYTKNGISATTPNKQKRRLTIQLFIFYLVLLNHELQLHNDQ